MNNILKTALEEYGTKGIIGNEDNPEVVKYFHEIGFEWVNDDETPWCAAFLNWVLFKCNITGTNKLNARSFLEIGRAVTFPTLGDIVVLWRLDPLGPYGHCGIYIGESKHLLFILGGNQSNMVNIETYPKSQLLGYRKILDTNTEK
jgi:uncharacterized protein (TIGR02594 family)